MMKSGKSIYQRAGEWGVPFGLYLSCTAVCSIFADWFMPLQFLFMVLLLGTPLVTYYFQRRKFIEDDGFVEYAGLWMLGIMLFILGTVLCSFIVFLVLQYIRPNFVYEQAQAAIDVYSTLPQMKDSELLSVLQHAIDEKALPTPIEMVMSTFWFVTFFGSLVSAIIAWIAQRPLPERRNRPNN
jgi:membrane associated rhomboid family serine protease